MTKEDLKSINEKLDRHTDILNTIKLQHQEEISLIKLSIQKLKYTGLVACVVVALSVGKPELIRLMSIIK